ncbi:MAG TPA: hypothetical protein VL976_03800 [Xanthobacteraceae bacterium]|nr:hypothetical protein [Xanthobacteraceae bacterium]
MLGDFVKRRRLKRDGFALALGFLPAAAARELTGVVHAVSSAAQTIADASLADHWQEIAEEHRADTVPSAEVTEFADVTAALAHRRRWRSDRQGDVRQVWLPLDAVGTDLPSLDTIPGTHRKMRKLPCLTSGDYDRDDVFAAARGTAVTPRLNPGTR